MAKKGSTRGNKNTQSVPLEDGSLNEARLT